MIITGGTCKGRRINTVNSREVRPTSSKVRESIFSMIFSSITNSVMLDLFAGSGIMGLEALSRGANKVIYVEKNPQVYRILKENLSKFDFDNEIILADALTTLDRFKDIKFDIIFIDPPYASGLIEPVLKKIINNDLLTKNGLIIIEHNSIINIKDIFKDQEYKILKEKKYGDTFIIIIQITCRH